MQTKITNKPRRYVLEEHIYDHNKKLNKKLNKIVKRANSAANKLVLLNRLAKQYVNTIKNWIYHAV